jgi:capsular polysaccharide biosynthesis protein/Mrp family chromosome partitioning ATPase
MLTWQEIWAYIRTLLRWWPVPVVAVALATGAAWFLARSQPDYYRASTSLMVGNNFEVTTPDRFAVDLSNTLARFYEVLVHREVILQPVVEQLQLPVGWWKLSEAVTTAVNPQANLLEIAVTDSDPVRAAAIANAIADRLINYSPASPGKIADQQAQLESQINETQAVLDDIGRRIAELEERQGQLNAAIDLRENQEQINELEKSRERYQESYSNLLLLRNNAQTNTLQVFEYAVPPGAPLPEKMLLTVGVAGFGGLLLSLVAIFLLDLLDTRWRSGRDLEARLGIVNLGSVDYRRGRSYRADAPEVRERSKDVRAAQTKLVLAANDKLPRLLLISSPQPSESRSAVAIDLANVYAQSGNRVLVVDVEPTQPNATRLLLPSLGSQAQPHSDGDAIELWAKSSYRAYTVPRELWMHLRATPLHNVALLPNYMPSGDSPGLHIPSHQWPELVDVLRQTADIVIFDGPSALLSADAALLAPLVDGVVLVLNANTDTRAEISESKERLERPKGARLLGAITVNEPRERAALPVGERIAVFVDAGGITISLGKPPAKKHTEPKRTPELPSPAPAADQARTSGPATATSTTAPATYDERVIVTPPPSVIITPPSPTPGASDAAKPSTQDATGSAFVSTPQMLLHPPLEEQQDRLQERAVGYLTPLTSEPETRTRTYISKGSGRRPRRS